MSASPREFTTMDVDTLNSMSIAQLEVALDSNYGVFKAKEAGAEGDDVCNTYLATVALRPTEFPGQSFEAQGKKL